MSSPFNLPERSQAGELPLASVPIARRRLATIALCASCVAVLAVAPAGGCGGVGVEAPEVNAPQTGTCESAEQTLEDVQSAWQDGPLTVLGTELLEPLVERGALRVAFPVFLAAAQDAPAGTKEAVLAVVAHDGDFDILLPHALNTLDYVVGDSVYLEGAHFSTLDGLHRIAEADGPRCHPQTLLSTLAELLVVEVETEDGRQRFTKVYLDAWASLARDPGFRAFLDDVEFSDDEEAEGEGISVGREAFVVAFRLLLASAAEPDLDIETLRDRIDELVLLQVLDGQDTTRARIDLVLELYDALREEAPELFVELQDVIACALDADEDGALLGMLYDYMSVQTLDFADLLDDLVVARDSPSGVLAVNLFVDVAQRLRTEPSRGRDLVQIIAVALEPQRTRAWLPALQSARGSGVRAKGVDVVRRLWGGCVDEPLSAETLATGGAQ